MIDVIIPTIEKDLPMLDKSIDAIRVNVLDGVNNVYVVGPKSDKIKDFCHSKKAEFVYESDLVGMNVDEVGIGYRNGWLYQQLIKLNGDKISNTEDFLVIDADHVLLKPHIFHDDKWHFYMSEEYHIPYFRAINLLFNGKYQKCVRQSFISDKMIINKNMLMEMRKEILLSFIQSNKECHNITLNDAIIRSYQRDSGSGFSEFETYGTWVVTNYGKDVVLHNDNRYMCMQKNIENWDFNKLKENFSQYMSITLFKGAN